MDADDDQPGRAVAIGPRLDVRLDVLAVDAGERPELDEHDLAAQRRHRQRVELIQASMPARSGAGPRSSRATLTAVTSRAQPAGRLRLTRQLPSRCQAPARSFERFEHVELPLDVRLLFDREECPAPPGRKQSGDPILQREVEAGGNQSGRHEHGEAEYRFGGARGGPHPQGCDSRVGPIQR